MMKMMNKDNQDETKKTVFNRIAERIRPLDIQKTNDRMMLAARIDDLLKEKKLSNKKLADLMNKEPSVISKWLSGTHNFTMDTLTEICSALNVSFSELFMEKPEHVVFKSQFAVAQSASPMWMSQNDDYRITPRITGYSNWHSLEIDHVSGMPATGIAGLGANTHDVLASMNAQGIVASVKKKIVPGNTDKLSGKFIAKTGEKKDLNNGRMIFHPVKA